MERKRARRALARDDYIEKPVIVWRSPIIMSCCIEYWIVSYFIVYCKLAGYACKRARRAHISNAISFILLGLSPRLLPPISRNNYYGNNMRYSCLSCGLWLYYSGKWVRSSVNFNCNTAITVSTKWSCVRALPSLLIFVFAVFTLFAMEWNAFSINKDCMTETVLCLFVCVYVRAALKPIWKLAKISSERLWLIDRN